MAVFSSIVIRGTCEDCNGGIEMGQAAQQRGIFRMEITFSMALLFIL
jgi:hypothetical protein